jgi:outer membrane translocation and assembly module TamA
MEISIEFPPIFTKIFEHKTGIIYDYNNYNVTDQRDNPFLKNEEVVGANGGVSSGLGLSMIWDSRDNIFYPSKGIYIKLKTLFYMKAIASDYDFNWYVADIRKYIGLRNQQIFAIQFFGSFVSDRTPFYEFPLLGGGQIMRGYFQGRYRDKLYMAGQAEYRRHLWRRFGMVAFAGAGDVSEKFRGFQIREFKTSLGFGLRFLFNKEENVNIRMDIGFGKDTNGIYFGVEEAF